ncbi:hypothetical protein JCM8097_001262 [Rhodosporidiobolus ruineniae]
MPPSARRTGLAAVALATLSSATRIIKIVNSCSYDVYPAVSPFKGLDDPYNDSTGWQQSSGSSKTITVPSTFQGRIWGRHGCVAQSDGTVVCVVGSCNGHALECGEAELGTGTALELRLQDATNGQYDVINLQNGAGWSMPVSVKPEANNCDEISCTPTLSTCPDDKLKLQDSYGAILGCKSACYGGIGDSNVQCCSGDYASAKACTSDKIQYFDYFHSACPTSMSYFEDYPSSGDTTQYNCLAGEDNGFTFTFCPDGDGDSNPSGSAASSGSGAKSGAGTSATSGGDNTDTGGAMPTGTAGNTQPSGVNALTASLSVNATATSSQASSAAASSALSAVATSASAAHSASTPSASASSSSSDDSSSSSSGMSNTMLYGIGGGVGAVAIIAVIIIGVCVHRRNQREAAQTANVEAAQAQAASASRAQPAARATTQGYMAVSRSGSNRSRSALLSQSEHDDSDATGSSEDEKQAAPSRSTSSRSLGRRSSRSSRR